MQKDPKKILLLVYKFQYDVRNTLEKNIKDFLMTNIHDKQRTLIDLDVRFFWTLDDLENAIKEYQSGAYDYVIIGYQSTGMEINKIVMRMMEIALKDSVLMIFIAEKKFTDLFKEYNKYIVQLGSSFVENSYLKIGNFLKKQLKNYLI